MRENFGQQDFDSNYIEVKDWLVLLLKTLGIVLLGSYFFYRSMWGVFPLAICGAYFFKIQLEELRDKKCKEIRIQFKECILSVSSLMKGGMAAETAFVSSMSDMQMLFGGSSYMYRELEIVKRGLAINIALEELLFNLGQRTGIDDIQQFAEVFLIAKRNSGNMCEIIANTAGVIARKIDTIMEIDTAVSGRKLELLLMQIMPFGVLMYIDISYGGYFDVLYHNMSGIFIMTGCLTMYLFSYMLGRKILKNIIREI